MTRFAAGLAGISLIALAGAPAFAADHFERYQDKKHTWTIYLKMRTGERIPVAAQIRNRMTEALRWSREVAS